MPQGTAKTAVRVRGKLACFEAEGGPDASQLFRGQERGGVRALEQPLDLPVVIQPDVIG